MLTILTLKTVTEVLVFYYCININNNIMEDEELVIFGCPEYKHVGLKIP